MKHILLYLAFFATLTAGAQTTLEAYGAKGDGVTDDYPAIAAALASANTTIYGTAGKTYAFGTAISIPTGKTFDGRGGQPERIGNIAYQR